MKSIVIYNNPENKMQNRCDWFLSSLERDGRFNHQNKAPMSPTSHVNQ